MLGTKVHFYDARTIAQLLEALEKGRQAIIHYSRDPDECVAAEIAQAIAQIKGEVQ